MEFKDIVKGLWNFNKPQPNRARLESIINPQQQLGRVKQDATKLSNAISAAESIEYPNRYLLTQTYQQIVLDGQYQSAMLQRKMRVMSQEFNLIDSNDDPNHEKTRELNQKWFYDFIDLAMESIPWGHSLVQFGPITNSTYDSVELVRRIYVVPEFNLVRETTATVRDGVDYTKAPYNNWAIGIGGKRDLGLLLKIAPYVIWKKNAMSAWSEYGEVFGSPLRTMKTDVHDEVTRLNAENMMRNMAINSWAVLGLEDEFNLLESKRTDAFEVFDRMVERCNSEITKIVLGQTGTTDEKAYAGSSSVHEGIAEMIGKQDMRMIEFIVNNQLIPMMQRVGFNFEGLQFKFDTSEQLSLLDQAKIDASFMAHVKYDKEYLENKYKIELSDDELPPKDIQNKLNNLYS